MPTAHLTTAYITGLKRRPPASGRVEIWDQKTPGLCLRISPNGAGTWCFRYRPRAGGGYQRITLGALDSIGLADARERAERHRVAIYDGSDPQRELIAKRAAAASALTFNGLAQRYLDEYAKPRKASWRNDESYLIRPRAAWGQRDARTITRRDAIVLLDEIKRAAPVSANRTHSVLVTLFNWAVEDQLLESNPLAGLKKRAVEQEKDRVITAAEFRVLWHTITTAGLSAEIVSAIQVLALLGQRPGEVVRMRRSELVDLDKPGAARWEIPAANMKARRAHVVPLPERARQILSEQIARATRDFVFASRFAIRERLARHSLSQALRRVILEMSAAGEDREIVEQLKANPPTPHDFRRSCATGMAALGIPREDRLAVLAHVPGDIHGAVYDKYERLREKRIALEAWEWHVAGLLAGVKPSTTVTMLPRGGR